MRRTYGAAIAVGLTLLLTGCVAGGPTTSPSVVPTLAETVAPTASEGVSKTDDWSAFVGTPAMESILIPADLGDTETATKLVENLQAWSAAGANEANYDYMFEGDNVYLGLTDYSIKVSDKMAAPFIEGMFVEGAEADTTSAISSTIDFYKLVNQSVLMGNFQTYGPQNEAQYELTMKFTSLDAVTESADGSKAYTITLAQDDNEELNIIEPNNNVGFTEARIPTVIENGIRKVSGPFEFTFK